MEISYLICLKIVHASFLGYRHQDSQTVCSSMPSICSTFKLPDPNRSTVVSAPPQLITTHKSTNSNDENFLYHKTVVTTQITTRTDMTCSVANSFTFAASNQIFRPSYPSNTNMQHGTWPLSHKGPSTNTNMQHGTWPLSHKGPLPDSSHATTFNPLVFPNHFADSRNSLKIRYLNLLARLFPQFSDIFINSVLEEARGELLAAAEWLVQLEDRRSFMYPTFDPFTPIPMLSPHFGNPNYTHNKTSYSHQASENSSKYLPSSTLHNSNNRFDKDCIPQPADLQSNIPKFFVTPQMMSAPGPPNMSCLLLPNENTHNKSSNTDARPYSRLSLVKDSSQLERSAPKSFSENRLVPQQNYFIQSHQACTPQYSTSAKPTEMEHASMVYSNDNSTGYASDKLTPDPNHAIACNANMVISNAKMIANNANMVLSNANVVTNNASMRAVSVREIPHVDGGQEFNCTTQDHQATDEQQSKLHCFALLSARQGKEEDVEQKLSVISEYIIENDDGEDGSQLHTKANTTDYRENDMDSDVSSRDSNDSNL